MQNWLPALSKPKQLFVEGREEEFLFNAFLRELGISNVQVQNCRGKDNLGPLLEAISQDTSFGLVQSIGIVRDADYNAASARQSVESSLRNSGFTEPLGDLPRVSIFIMPDDASPGALEDLCLAALSDDPAMPCVADFLRCVNDAVFAPPQHPAKARIHAFLASREDPELRLGEAAQRGYIPWDNPAFDGLSQFLRSL